MFHIASYPIPLHIPTENTQHCHSNKGLFILDFTKKFSIHVETSLWPKFCNMEYSSLHSLWQNNNSFCYTVHSASYKTKCFVRITFGPVSDKQTIAIPKRCS